MEMTKKPIAAKPEIAPSPFSPRAEREELERAQLLPSTTSTTTNSTQSSSSSHNYVVPTAVPIIEGGDAFNENSVPVVAVAASLPPPPPSDYRRANANENTAAHKNYSTTNSDKSKSFIDDDDIIVRPEPTSNSSISSPLLLPTAPTLPTHTSNLPSTHQLTTSAQIRAANVQATISSEEEIAHVARAQRTRKYAIQHHAGQGVRMANEIANRKVGKSDEGLTVDEGIHNVNLNADSLQQQQRQQGGEKNKQGDDDDDVRPYGVKQPSGKRGYDVKEYDVTEYETGEYDVAEYKSVYD
ncbi:hypothetical protein ACHAXR_008882 [Thalassiosira sp. AJA248-18]